MNTQPVPAYAVIHDQLIGILNTLVNQDVDEVSKAREFQKLEALAADLKNISQAHGLSVMGSIAAARKNIPAMREYHRRAIRMEKDIVLRTNYATSLYVTGLLDEAYDAALAIHSDHKDDVEVLDLLVKVAWAMEQYGLFDEYADLFEKLTGRQHDIARAEDESDVRLAEEALASPGPQDSIPWEKVKEELGL